MRHGLLVAILSALLCAPTLAHAVEISSQEREHLLQDASVQSSAEAISSLVLSGHADQAQFQLQRIKFPQQEAVRFLVLKNIESLQPIYTSDLAVFLDQQKKIQPTLTYVEKGDGFQFSAPAYSYQITAQRMLDEWHLNEQVMQFYIGVENEELDLRSWLSGDAAVVAQREHLLIESVHSLSSDGLQFLTEQITGPRVTSWLPSSNVMVALASVSKDQDLYSLLWKMKADGNINSELNRLGHQDSDFAHQQLMAASENPSLSQRSLHMLSRYATTSPKVEEFLLGKMRNQQQAKVISDSLRFYGHGNWLKQLVQDNPGITLP